MLGSSSLLDIKTLTDLWVTSSFEREAVAETGTAEAGTAEAMTAEAVTGEAMTAEAVTAEAITAEAVIAEAVTAEALFEDGVAAGPRPSPASSEGGEALHEGTRCPTGTETFQ